MSSQQTYEERYYRIFANYKVWWFHYKFSEA